MRTLRADDLGRMSATRAKPSAAADPYNVERFAVKQREDHARALRELRNGRKALCVSAFDEQVRRLAVDDAVTHSRERSIQKHQDRRLGLGLASEQSEILVAR